MFTLWIELAIRFAGKARIAALPKVQEAQIKSRLKHILMYFVVANAVTASGIVTGDVTVYGVAVPNCDGKAGAAAIAQDPKAIDLAKLYTALSSRLPVIIRFFVFIVLKTKNKQFFLVLCCSSVFAIHERVGDDVDIQASQDWLRETRHRYL